mgnify:FL=1
MYDRYARENLGNYVRASLDDSPLPPPPRKPSGQAPPPPRPQQPPKPPPRPPQSGPPPKRPPEIAFGKSILDALHLDDLDTGDLLLLFLLFFLFKQQADEELLIAIGLLLIL